MASRKLKKGEVRNVSNQAKTYFNQFGETLLEPLKELCLTESHIKENEQRMEICSLLFEQRGFVLKLFDKFSELYDISFKGAHADRLANLNMKWLSYISEYIKQDTIQCNELKAILRKDYSPEDLSATMHCVANRVKHSAQGYISKCRPTQSQILNKVSPMKDDSEYSVLAFAGACMLMMQKLARKQNKIETYQLIRNLTMTKSQREYMIEHKVIRHAGLKQLSCIPLHTLYPYLWRLNKEIQECCTERALSLYNDKFLKVSTEKIELIVDDHLMPKFKVAIDILKGARPNMEIKLSVVLKVEATLRRKMLNARLNGFITVHYNKTIQAQGGKTEGAFCLRDDLYGITTQAKKKK